MSKLLSDEDLTSLLKNIYYRGLDNQGYPDSALEGDVATIKTQKRLLLHILKESIKIQTTTRYTEEGLAVAIGYIDRYIEVVSE